MYDRDRFFTVTGSHMPETREDIARRQDALRAVHHDYVQTIDREATALPETVINCPSQTGVGETEVTGRSSSPRLNGPNSETHGPSAYDFSAVDDPALEATLHGLPPEELPDSVPQTIDEIAGPGVSLPDTECSGEPQPQRAEGPSIVAFVSHRTPDRTQSGDQVCKQFQTLL